MNPFVRIFRPVVLIAVAVSLAGCYTLLKHPSTDDGYEHADFSRCNECHTEYHHFTPYDPLYPDLWWDYYSLPWWYDDVTVIDGEGEVPFRRAIHDMNLMHRDEQPGTGTIGIKRQPPSGTVIENDEAGGASVGTEEKQTEKREKQATKTKQTSKRERDDGKQNVKKKSDTGEEEKKEQGESGGETRRDKKRKMK